MNKVRKELDEALVKDFPNLYRDRNADMRSTAMCWGFECGDGWEPIIRDLSEELEAEILKLPEEDRQYCKASQVKEKYGTLRFYMSMETDEMDRLIRLYTDKSDEICEQCGKPGQLRGNGWLFVACDEHSKDQKPHSELLKEERQEIEKQSFLQNLKDRFYFITRWFMYPKYCWRDLKQNIQWKLWKLNRKLKGKRV